jgi:two-component system chemotaxis response regulator CheY
VKSIKEQNLQLNCRCHNLKISKMEKIERFIVVDDDPTSNLLCEYILKRGFESIRITLFSIPEDALKTINEEYANSTKRVNTVLLLDINMPTMSGCEFLEEFNHLSKAIHAQFTIFILSSSVDERDKEKAAINPFISGFLCKPFSINAIKQLLDGRKPKEQEDIK